MSKVVIALVLLAGAQPPGRYQFDAAGRAVRIDQAWELRSGGDAIAVFMSAARCGRDIFLSDTQNNVFRIDSDQPTSTLARFAGEDQGIGRATALAVDCARRRLYVLNSGPRTVVTLDTGSGAVVATRPFSRELYEPRALVLAGRDVLLTGGLWNTDETRSLPDRQQTTFYDQTWIGERLSLSSGIVTPGLAPYENRCVAAGACTTADLDGIGEGASRGWIAAQGISTKVALYNAQGTRTSTFDVTSPKFVRDGTAHPVATKPPEIERWRSRNSVIRRVFAIGSYLVAVHSLTVIGPSWTFGETPQFQVFMNIYAADGKPLVSDVRLPDLPIGRDATHLYAIDYGPEGRGQATERVRLVRLPVAAGAGILP